MKKINLRELYPDAYTTDFFVNVTEDVLETIRASERAEAAYERKMYRYKAQYSLDCENGIENAVLTKPQTPEMVLEEKQLQKQVYATVQPYAISPSGDSRLHQPFAVYWQSAGYAALPAISAGRNRKSAAPFSLGRADAYPVP